MKFKKGDRVCWVDGVVGEATGVVKSAWIDSRIGQVLYVERGGHKGERYPVGVVVDQARKLGTAKRAAKKARRVGA